MKKLQSIILFAAIAGLLAGWAVIDPVSATVAAPPVQDIVQSPAKAVLTPNSNGA